MFTIPEGQSFWQSFSDQVIHFKKLTKDMSEEKVFSLMSDPACSGNFAIIVCLMNIKQLDLYKSS